MSKALVVVFGIVLCASLRVQVARADDRLMHNAAAAGPAAPCAGCHRSHAAAAEKPSVKSSVAELCKSCHGNTGPGSTLNVMAGVYAGAPPAGTGSGLKGGGFSNTVMWTTPWDRPGATGGPSNDGLVTSMHSFNGARGLAWGNVAAGTTGAGLADFALTCTNCHDPHGGAGPGGTPTYRLLRVVPANSGAPEGATYENPGLARAVRGFVADEAPKAYTVTDPTNKYFGEIYWRDARDPSRRDALSLWCSQCHTRYDRTRGNPDEPPALAAAADQGVGASPYSYRHLVRPAGSRVNCSACHSDQGEGGAYNPLGIDLGPDPLFVMTGPHEPVCLTCHVAHGTSATMSDATFSGTNILWADGTSSASANARSSLLRLDNRGVCRGCHGGK